MGFYYFSSLKTFHIHSVENVVLLVTKL